MVDAGDGLVSGGRAPRVFISYAHESDQHVETVRDLWIFLRSNGVDATLDRLAAQRRQDWPLWMERQLRLADHILVIASAAYRERAEGESGPDVGRGVQWEARLIRDAFYRDQEALDRFVPVVLPSQSREGVPGFLAPATCTVYTVTAFTVAGATSLLRLLLNQPEEIEPPLGRPPALGTREPALSTPTALVASATSSDRASTLRHRVEVHVEPDGDGVRARTELSGTILGEHVAPLPGGLADCWAELDSPMGAEQLGTLGRSLWETLFDPPTGRRLQELIVESPFGTVADVVVFLPVDLAGLPVELLRLPDGRLAATAPGVWLTRRLREVDRPATPPSAGPLKILAAPEESRTPSASLDVEAEMQALLDAVTDLDVTGDTTADPVRGRRPDRREPGQRRWQGAEALTTAGEVGHAVPDAASTGRGAQRPPPCRRSATEALEAAIGPQHATTGRRRPANPSPTV